MAGGGNKNGSEHGSKGAVFLAVIGNGFLTIIKFVAFLLTGSGALMSEAIHSFADTANQGLLFVGNLRSTRPADDRYHYGYGAERYVFALLSAMGIFVLGCGVTIYHGIHSLLHPPDLTYSWIAFAVLGISFAIEGMVFISAVREINRERGQTSFFAFMAASSDPTLIAVVLEDFVASTGVLVAAAGIGLSWWTGNPAYDSASSIVIGTLLGFLAVWLGWRNRQLILGPSVGPEKSAAVVDFLNRQPSIDTVEKVRTRIVGAKQFRLAADVDWNGHELGRQQTEWLRERIEAHRGPDGNIKDDIDYQELAMSFGDRLLESLGDEVDRIEALLSKEFPELANIDIEAD